MARRDVNPVTNRQKLSDMAEVQLDAKQRLLTVLWCLYPEAFQALRRDVLPRYVDDLVETNYRSVKGPLMWTQVGRVGGLQALAQLAGHHYLHKSGYPGGRGYLGPLDTLLLALRYRPRSAERAEIAKARYDATLRGWKLDHGFARPWSDSAFFWVLGQWLKNPFLYRQAFPALPQLIYHPDPNLILLEEGPTFSVVPELKPYLSEQQWWALSDSLAHTYEVAIRQWRRDLGVVKTWSPNFEALRKAYFAEAAQKRQYRKVKEDDAFVQFAIREVEGHGYDLIAKGFGLSSSTVEGHVKDVAELLGFEPRTLSGGRREGKPGRHGKDAQAHIKALRSGLEGRAAQAKALTAQWVLPPGLAYEVTLTPDPDRFVRVPRRSRHREPLYPRLRLTGGK